MGGRGRTAVAVLTALCVGACSGGVPSTRALRPPHEQAVVLAGSEGIPADAQLSVDVTRALAQADPGKVREHRRLYVTSTGRALGLTRRYVDNPFRVGRFLVSQGRGPTAGVLGRAAAALTMGTASLDVAVLNAPSAMRAPTLRLRADLLRLGDSLRRGNTVGAADRALLQRLVTELVSTGASNRLRLRGTKAPTVTPVVVVPQWSVARRARIAAARRQINLGMGALRRYLLAPGQRGVFAAGASSRSRRRAQQRALHALQYAQQQWSAAANLLAGDARLSPMTVALARQQRALTPLLAAARRSVLRPGEAATAGVIIDALVRAGTVSKIRLRPARSPTFQP